MAKPAILGVEPDRSSSADDRLYSSPKALHGRLHKQMFGLDVTYSLYILDSVYGLYRLDVVCSLLCLFGPPRPLRPSTRSTAQPYPSSSLPGRV